MADESSGSPVGGPPTGPPQFPGQGPPQFPGNAPPPMPPPVPPSYPAGPGGPGGGLAPPPPGQYGAPAYGAPGHGAPTGVPYAPWLTRVGGWLIDFVIFLVINGILSRIVRDSNALTLHFTTKTNGGTVIHHDHISFVPLIVTFVLEIAYGTILCGSARGQTVGMMAVGVRAVRDDNLGVLGYGPAFVRALVEGIFGYTIIIWIIDMLFPLWDRKRQTLHDKVVSSVVLQVRNAG